MTSLFPILDRFFELFQTSTISALKSSSKTIPSALGGEKCFIKTMICFKAFESPNPLCANSSLSEFHLLKSDVPSRRARFRIARHAWKTTREFLWVSRILARNFSIPRSKNRLRFSDVNAQFEIIARTVAIISLDNIDFFPYSESTHIPNILFIMPESHIFARTVDDKLMFCKQDNMFFRMTVTPLSSIFNMLHFSRACDILSNPPSYRRSSLFSSESHNSRIALVTWRNCTSLFALRHNSINGDSPPAFTTASVVERFWISAESTAAAEVAAQSRQELDELDRDCEVSGVTSRSILKLRCNILISTGIMPH
mmetsp:Transcript_13874/g.47960  ORF Transcript_13874/g.47960 Transcript_13874/m.47960 type:complete len:312 (-) Transcript_13874:318-1253(-)